MLDRLLFARFVNRVFFLEPALHNSSLAGGWKFVGASYDYETGEIKLWVDGALKQAGNMGPHKELGTQGSVRMGVRKTRGSSKAEFLSCKYTTRLYRNSKY